MRTVSSRTLAELVGAEPLDRPAYGSLARRLRRLISDGRLLVGTRLPSERDIASALGLSRTTVIAALDLLRNEGFVHTRRGSGSVTALPFGRTEAATQDGLMPSSLSPEVVDLTYAALPAAPGVTEAFERALAQLPRFMATSGYHPHGIPEVRVALANWYQSRGLPTDPDHIVITCGAHAGLTATLRALTDPGDRVLIETPTYPNALVGIRRSGLRLLATPVGPNGWAVPELRATLSSSRPLAAYLVPDFQNPTGHCMSAADRETIAVGMRRSGTLPIIDETFAELWIDGPPPASFATHAPQAVTLGSAAKTWWGGLRIGWIRAPRELVTPILQARHSLDLGTPVLEQLVLAELLTGAANLLDQRRDDVRARRHALVAALRRHLPDWRFRMPPGGLGLWCELPEARGEILSTVAESHGVRVPLGSQFDVQGRMRRFVRLPFAAPTDQCDDIGRRLAAAWSDALARPLHRAAGQRRDDPPLIA